MESRIKSQRLYVGDLFMEGWRLYNANLTNILGVVLCVYIPINLVLALLPADVRLLEDSPQGVQLYNNLVQLLEFFIGIIATMGIAAIVEKAVHGETLSWDAALRHGLARWPSAIGTGLLTGLILLGLTLLLIIPGLIWSIYYAFWIYVVALRDMGGRTALRYSKSLVQGQWWRVFGAFFVIGLVGLVVVLTVTFLLHLIASNPLADFIINTVVNVIGAFFLVVTVLFFLNTDYVQNGTSL
ncbi:MAG: hypothetical protein R3E79_45520 [Caldilineaceae bacterium]